MSWRAFFDGAARVLDLFGTMSRPVDLPETDEEAFAKDAQALAEDWHMALPVNGIIEAQSFSLTPAQQQVISRGLQFGPQAAKIS